MPGNNGNIDGTQASSNSNSILKRRFVNITTSKTSQPSVCIMQWNVLAQALTDGTSRCSREALQWDYRSRNLLEEITSVNPDVICLQEVDRFEFFRTSLASQGYVGSFFPKPDSPALIKANNTGPDGCAVFTKTAVCEVVDSRNIVLEIDNDPTNQVAIISQLRHVESKRLFYVVCTHLKAKKSFSDYRLKQGTFLLQHLEKTCANLPLVVCGDFNADPEEPIVKAFSANRLELTNAYAQGPKYVLPYTTAKWRETDTGETKLVRIIDYIWHSKAHFTVSALRPVPTEDEMGVDLVPSFKYPSDHLSLAVQLTFT